MLPYINIIKMYINEIVYNKLYILVVERIVADQAPRFGINCEI